MGGVWGATNYRAYVGSADNAALSQRTGGSANDGLTNVQGGFKLDGSRRKNTWMLDGDLFRGAENNIGVRPSLATQSIVESPSHFITSAGSLNAEWRHRWGETGELRIQSTYDFADRPEPQASEVETRTWDTELQYDYKAGQVHNLSFGTGERLISFKSDPDGTVTFSSDLTYTNLNGFVQDEMHFVHDTLLVTLGAKLEHNHFGGWDSEPSAIVLWMPRKHHSFWISASRSIHTPSLFEVAVDAPFGVFPGSLTTGGLPVLARFAGSPAFSSESVRDFEAGYKGQISRIFSVDAALFYDQFSNIRSFVSGTPVVTFSPIPHLDLAESTANGAGAIGKGGEASFGWQILQDWKLEGSYTYSLITPWLSSSAAPGSVDGGGKEPSRNKWRLQSYLNLSKNWKLDAFLYWTGRGSPVTTAGQSNVPVPPYTRLDLRLGYKVGRHWQLSLAGQNLLQSRHLEGTTRTSDCLQLRES
jgi:iron complex outermembrane receptor protein